MFTLGRQESFPLGRLRPLEMKEPLFPNPRVARVKRPGILPARLSSRCNGSRKKRQKNVTRGRANVNAAPARVVPWGVSFVPAGTRGKKC